MSQSWRVCEDEVNRFTGQRTPAASFENIAAETLRKLDIEVTHGKFAAE